MVHCVRYLVRDAVHMLDYHWCLVFDAVYMALHLRPGAYRGLCSALGVAPVTVLVQHCNLLLRLRWCVTVKSRIHWTTHTSNHSRTECETEPWSPPDQTSVENIACCLFSVCLVFVHLLYIPAFGQGACMHTNISDLDRFCQIET